MKKRMDSKNTRERATSERFNDEAFEDQIPVSINHGKGPRGASQFNHVPKPTRPISGISKNMTREPQETYKNNNYRKAFNPDDSNRDQM